MKDPAHGNTPHFCPGNPCFNFWHSRHGPLPVPGPKKAITGEADIFITNNDKWAASNLITKNASSYRVGAACGNGKITLYVDGKQVASVSDSSYTSGYVGLFAWSGENVDAADVTFDDYVIRSLE